MSLQYRLTASILLLPVLACHREGGVALVTLLASDQYLDTQLSHVNNRQERMFCCMLFLLRTCEQPSAVSPYSHAKVLRFPQVVWSSQQCAALSVSQPRLDPLIGTNLSWCVLCKQKHLRVHHASNNNYQAPTHICCTTAGVGVPYNAMQ